VQKGTTSIYPIDIAVAPSTALRNTQNTTAHVADTVWNDLLSTSSHLPTPNPSDLLQYKYVDGRRGMGHLIGREQPENPQDVHAIRIGGVDHTCFKTKSGTVRLCVADRSAAESVDVNWLSILMSHKLVPVEEAVRVFINFGDSLDGFHELHHQLWHLPISCPDFPEYNRDPKQD